jgi:hypothetical protein
LLTEALKGIGAADNKLLQQAHTKADHQQSEQPRRRLIKRHLIPQCLTSRSNDDFATLDTSDRQRRISGYEEAVGVPLFRTVG